MKLEFLPLKKIVPPSFRGDNFFTGGDPPPLFSLDPGGTRWGTNFKKIFFGGGDPPPVPPCRENPEHIGQFLNLFTIIVKSL